jgi:hypothetical protein
VAAGLSSHQTAELVSAHLAQTIQHALQQFRIVASGLQQTFQHTAIHHVQASALDGFAHSVKRHIDGSFCSSFSSFRRIFCLGNRFCGSIASGLCFGCTVFYGGFNFGCGFGSGGLCGGGSLCGGGGGFSFGSGSGSFSLGSGGFGSGLCFGSSSFGSGFSLGSGRFGLACLVCSLFDNFCHRLYHFGGLTRLDAKPNANRCNCSRNNYKQGLVHVFVLLNGNFMKARYDRIHAESKVNFAAPAKTTALSCGCNLGA